MRRTLAFIALVLVLLAAFCFGRVAGALHVIYDSEIWTVEVYDPANDYGGYDQIIYIEIDGQVWTHTMIQD